MSIQVQGAADVDPGAICGLRNRHIVQQRNRRALVAAVIGECIVELIRSQIGSGTVELHLRHMQWLDRVGAAVAFQLIRIQISDLSVAAVKDAILFRQHLADLFSLTGAAAAQQELARDDLDGSA